MVGDLNLVGFISIICVALEKEFDTTASVTLTYRQKNLLLCPCVSNLFPASTIPPSCLFTIKLFAVSVRNLSFNRDWPYFPSRPSDFSPIYWISSYINFLEMGKHFLYRLLPIGEGAILQEPNSNQYGRHCYSIRGTIRHCVVSRISIHRLLCSRNPSPYSLVVPTLPSCSSSTSFALAFLVDLSPASSPVLVHWIIRPLLGPVVPFSW